MFLFNSPSHRTLPALAILTFVMLARSLALPSSQNIFAGVPRGAGKTIDALNNRIGLLSDLDRL
jgi:hypothetical protein